MPARALEPAGVALVDKPAGPSSFAIVAQIRRVTGARTGHAGTLDPFATGLLLVLSGRTTKLAPCLVGLDKRYRTEIVANEMKMLDRKGDENGGSYGGGSSYAKKSGSSPQPDVVQDEDEVPF